MSDSLAPAVRRLRRMTPLERTRILPPPADARSSPLPPGNATPAYVRADDGGLGPIVPPVWLSDPKIRGRRRRIFVEGSVYQFELWLAERIGPSVLVSLLPALMDVLAEYACGADEYESLLERFWAGDLSAPARKVHPFTEACEAMEAEGMSEPDPDLATENYLEVEVELFNLTGAWGLDLTDDEAVDALNAVENRGEGVSPAAALDAFLRPLGKSSSYHAG